MGCDIHLYREKKIGGKWVTADEWEKPEWSDEDDERHVPYEKAAYNNRNYQLFGALSSGVRAEPEFAFQERGVPFNMSPEVESAFNRWDADGHSHSYLYLHELRDFAEYLDTATIRIEGMKDAAGLAELQATIDAGAPDWDKLFPYCAYTNAAGSVHFELDVPASFYIGKGIAKIIGSFDGIDGENHRIVFWFDN